MGQASLMPVPRGLMPDPVILSSNKAMMWGRLPACRPQARRLRHYERHYRAPPSAAALDHSSSASASCATHSSRCPILRALVSR